MTNPTPPPIYTPEWVANKILEELRYNSESLNGKLDSYHSEMVTMREQMATMIQKCSDQSIICNNLHKRVSNLEKDFKQHDIEQNNYKNRIIGIAMGITIVFNSLVFGFKFFIDYLRTKNLWGG